MRTIPIVLSGGVVSQLAVSGRYFRLMTTTSAVDVDLMNRGRVVYEAVNVQAGFWAVPDGGYDGVRITSAAGQTIQVAVSNGNGGYDRATGDVNILPGSSIESITNPVKIQFHNGENFSYGTQNSSGGSANTYLLTQDGGYAYGANFATLTAQAANTPGTIFTPAANVNGAILWSLSQDVSSATAFHTSIIAKSGAAPANPADGDVLLITGGAAGAVTTLNLIRSVRIAAGKGLYCISNQAEGQRGTQACYSLL